MPAINQYSATPRELVELLIKAADVREGRWFLVANFGFSPGNFGATAAQLAPGVAVVLQGLGIQRELPGVAPEILVDAAKVKREVPEQDSEKPGAEPHAASKRAPRTKTST
jgi:hypothetical protein